VGEVLAGTGAQRHTIDGELGGTAQIDLVS